VEPADAGQPHLGDAVDPDPASFTPPHSRDRYTGAEFDRPPAPPPFAGPASRPVTDPAARPLPTRRPEPERAGAAAQGAPSLPTRSRGSGPDGPDRLAGLAAPAGSARPVAPTAPGSLRAALTAFEAGKAGARPEPPAPQALPTRQPGSGFDHDAVTPSTSPSRLDPDVIRERLRSFQQEFQLGRDSEAAGGHEGDHPDLGGER
jgi:hypothetical protein